MLQEIKSYSAEIMKNDEVKQGMKREVLISWEPPNWAKLKLNSDGAFCSRTGRAKAGGLLRNHYGVRRGVFVFNIDCCSTPMQNIFGLYKGLLLAWESGVRT
ncbi:hypothetical protein RCOM_1610390 [Ricinus communis]|uniref:RNase H type-1 domain-containing protein n=1 Tax=Ricinus communis TaxID=3988 RepID=B9RD65_RICCO|nr:hypothetical protein RCOM_1610390 [Ricinus communis]